MKPETNLVCSKLANLDRSAADTLLVRRASRVTSDFGGSPALELQKKKFD